MKKLSFLLIILILSLSVPLMGTRGRVKSVVVLLKELPKREIDGLEVVLKTKDGYLGVYSNEKPLNIPHKILRDVRDGVEGYHTYETLTEKLREYEKNYPDLITLKSIGKSFEGRDIWAVRIGKERDKRILFIGCHHAREWMSVEIPLKIIDYLVSNYDKDKRVKEWVDSIEIWVVPMLNPDGHNYTVKVDRMWRKNRRDNGDGTFGVDNNRNYGYKWGLPGSSGITSSETYRGPYPFSEFENQAIRDLAYNHPFNIVVSYHSFSELILYPWGYTKNPPPDEEIFERIAEDMAKTTGPPNDNDYPGPYDYYPMQSSYLYPTSGDSDDWFYGDMGTLSFTIELNSFDEFFDPPPEKIEPTWNQTKGIVFTALNYAGINGLLKLHIEREDKEPYSGDVYIEEKKIKRKTQKDGLFIYFLLPGEYTIDVKGVKKRIKIEAGKVTEERMVIPSKVDLNVKVFSKDNKIPLFFKGEINGEEIEAFKECIFHNLEPGTYNLKISSLGFQDFEGSVDIKKDKEIDIFLEGKPLFISKFPLKETDPLKDDKNLMDYQYIVTDKFPKTRLTNFVLFNKKPEKKVLDYFEIKDLKEKSGKIVGTDGVFKERIFNLKDGSSFNSEAKPLFLFNDKTFASVERNRNIFFSFNPNSLDKKDEFLNLLIDYLKSNLKVLDVDYKKYTNSDSVFLKVKFLRNSYIKIKDNFYYLKDGEGKILIDNLHEGKNRIKISGFVNDREIVSKNVEVIVDKTPPKINAKDEFFTNDGKISFSVYDKNLKDVNVSMGEVVSVESSNGLKTYNVKLNIKSDGDYTIRIVASDIAGNSSEKSTLIHYDTKPPKLIKISPKDEEMVFNKDIVIEGEINEDAYVYINGKFVKSNGRKFKFPVKLNPEENIFEIKIVDLSMNVSIYRLRILYEGKKIILKIGDKTAWINSKPYTLDYPPFILNGRTFVPLRFIVEGFGGKVFWDGEEKRVTIKFEDKTLILWIKNREAILNGERVFIDENKNIYPIILNGRTFIPIRFIAESLGFEVFWNGITKTVTIRR